MVRMIARMQLLEFHQEIYVALWPELTGSRRSEQLKAGDVKPSAQVPQFFFVLSNVLHHCEPVASV